MSIALAKYINLAANDYGYGGTTEDLIVNDIRDSKKLNCQVTVRNSK